MAGRIFEKKMINIFFILTMIAENDLDYKPMLKIFILFFILLFHTTFFHTIFLY